MRLADDFWLGICASLVCLLLGGLAVHFRKPMSEATLWCSWFIQGTPEKRLEYLETFAMITGAVSILVGLFLLVGVVFGLIHFNTIEM